jgi:hypothetical protein
VKAVFALVAIVAALAAAPSLAQEKPDAVQLAAVGVTREALAERYLLITNRYALALGTYEKQLKRAMSGCDGKPCQSDLYRAIEETLADIGPRFRQRMIRIYADHLTEDQLRAAISFAETPVGRSISDAESGMTDAVADTGNELWKDANVGVSRRFCAVQQQICVRSASGAPPTASLTKDQK